MRIVLSVLLFTFLFTSLKAQEKEGFRFDLMGVYGIGFGVAENSNEPDYNFRTRQIDLILNFDLGKLFGFSTGVGVSTLSANGFNSNGDFFHTRNSLKIPLSLSLLHPISEQFEFYASGGFFWEQILEDEFQYLNSILEDVYEGSGFGGQFQIGLFLNPPDNIDWAESRIGILAGAQLGSNQETSEFSGGNNTLDLGDIFSLSVVASLAF